VINHIRLDNTIQGDTTMKIRTFAIRSSLLPLFLGLTLGAGRAQAGDGSADVQAAHADIQKTLGFVPRFLRALPDEAAPGLWQEMKTLQLNPGTALPGKTKELIGLAVAAQIPCRYCIQAHTEFARLNGASDRELGEAVAMAGLTRHWSTFANGMQLDEATFRAQIGQVVAGARKASAAGSTPPRPMAVTDGASAQEDIRRSLGLVPDFIGRFPDTALAGAWTELKSVQLSPGTALPGKTKELIGLAVAAQIPCHYCIIAHTEFARLNGASDREIAEAVAMASLTRNLSTMLNGLQVDEVAFKQDIGRLVAGAKHAAATASRQGRKPPR
jgi:AhpD family alkylhydroperoxidase